MTHSELRDEVRANVRRSTNALANSRITTWLNWAIDLIADLHTFEEMRQIVTGSTQADYKRYSFPSSMKDIHSLKLIDGTMSRKLICVSSRHFDKNIPRPETYAKGRSTWYVDYGTLFELYKIPDKAYDLELRASFYPTHLSGDADTIKIGLLNVSFSRIADKLSCYAATAEGLDSLKEHDDAKTWWNKFYAAYKVALQTDHSAEDWEPIAREFTSTRVATGEYWNNPLIRSMS